MSRINDDQSQELLRSQAKRQAEQRKSKQFFTPELGDKILSYVQSAFWVGAAAAVIYYSNFFHHLFRNPRINEIFFQLSIVGYTFIVMLMLFSSFVLRYYFKLNSIEEYNPKLVSVGAVVGVIAVLSLLIAIWPVWGFTSLLIFVALWKGFFSIAAFLPGGPIGDALFILINAGSVLSFYVIEHEGYFH